ncbi:MAG: hypothetical protein J3K34DRAFT_426951 [Monoraphidium minutum]|nr:MAG: hypothetical protein J3K34DRAFT_426951 [Monoraphidium minutum]
MAALSALGYAERARALSAGQGLTKMSKYHRKRCCMVQLLERDIADKAAEAERLERDNAALRRRALILDTLVGAVEKQLDLMAGRSAPTPCGPLALEHLRRAQELCTPGGAPHGSAVPRRWLHRLLECSDAVSTLSWSAEEARKRWRGFTDRLAPLLAEAEAAQEAAAEAVGAWQEVGEAAANTRVTRRRADRQALGLTAVDRLVAAAYESQLRTAQTSSVAAGAAPAGLACAATSSGGGGGAAPRPAVLQIPDNDVFMELDLEPDPSELRTLGSMQPASHALQCYGSLDSRASAASQVLLHAGSTPCPAGGSAERAATGAGSGGASPCSTAQLEPPPDAAGVPLEIFCEICDIIENNFIWLVSLLRYNAPLASQLILCDTETGATPAPTDDARWDALLARLRLSPAQLQELADSHGAVVHCQESVLKQRAGLCLQLGRTAEVCPQDSIACTNSGSSQWIAALARHCRHADALEGLLLNLGKEGTIHNLVPFYHLGVFSPFQLAKLCVYSAPVVPAPWLVAAAASRSQSK